MKQPTPLQQKQLDDAGKVRIVARNLCLQASIISGYGEAPDVIARGAMMAFLEMGQELVGDAALIEWLRTSADQLEGKLFTLQPPAGRA